MATKKKHRGKKLVGKSQRPRPEFTKKKGFPVKAKAGPVPPTKEERDAILREYPESGAHKTPRSVRKKYTGKNVPAKAKTLPEKGDLPSGSHNVNGLIYARKKTKVKQVPMAKEHQPYRKAEPEIVGYREVTTTVPGKKGVQKEVVIKVPVYATSKPGTVPISRTHNGHVYQDNLKLVNDYDENGNIVGKRPRKTATKFFKGKHEAKPKGDRKNPKAKFTWQERNEMKVQAIIEARNAKLAEKANKPKQPKVAKVPAWKKRSLAALARHQRKLDGKAYRRAQPWAQTQRNAAKTGELAQAA